MVKVQTNKRRASPAGPSQFSTIRRGRRDNPSLRNDADLNTTGPSSSNFLLTARSPRTAFLKRAAAVSASGDEIFKWIEDFGLREDQPNYGFDIADFGAIDTKCERAVAIWDRFIGQGPVHARRLISFVVRGSNSNQTARTQLTDLLNVIEAPNLETVKILRPGLSCRTFEEALYGFLSASSESLTAIWQSRLTMTRARAQKELSARANNGLSL
ncbi:hypothetical protein BD626DRAFT_534631 [Schizophyllum amplum]|uniref:Uncharacterized protein n=1 Tax=Schizophyllum amplum TaxID=97359 RepID=A0A550CV57_9AGAR|nr:hypothetical protein BD626DRAFT_534631 [Auriculariopsis ampla]